MDKPPYEVTTAILRLYGKIHERLGLCQGLMMVRPEARLRRENRIRTIHSSLAIEGNTLGMDQVTAVLNNQRVVAPAREIMEVQNAVRAYEQLGKVDPLSERDFLKVHGLLTVGLVDEAGSYRSGSVGILKGGDVQHVAPGASMVPSLMNNLFTYLREDGDPTIIKSCVFHYEMEFIHPFQDGNGRMGRYWQTRILMEENPLFEYLPVEAAVREKQAEYYNALATADRMGTSTVFVEYMMERILETLESLLEDFGTRGSDHARRVEYALSRLDGWFDRKMFLEVCKGVSTATASRDLRRMIEDNIVIVSGTGRMTRYHKNR
jgi:Fic family protein